MQPKTLRGIGILKGLTDEARVRIEQSCSWKTWESGNVIVHFEDNTRDVYFLVDGRARVIVYSPEGKIISFRHVGPGDMFGEFAAIDDAPRSASVEAIDNCLVACTTSAGFWNIMRSHPSVMEAVLRHAVAMMRSLTSRIVEYSTHAVDHRVRAELLRLAKDGTVQGSEVIISPVPTHAEIASRISTHREAVAREWARLARTGVIERRGSRLAVKDIERLTQMVERSSDE